MESDFFGYGISLVLYFANLFIPVTYNAPGRVWNLRLMRIDTHCVSDRFLRRALNWTSLLPHLGVES